MTRAFSAALLLASCMLLSAAPAGAEGLRTNVHQSGSISGLHASSPAGIPPHAPGYLGILFGNLTEDQAVSLHLKDAHGVVIVMVDHDGPAGKVGLRPSDVILSMNGQPVTSADDLRRMIHDAGVGAPISLLVLRGQKRLTLSTKLAYRGEVEREAAERMELPNPAGADGASGDGLSDVQAGEPAPDSTLSRNPGFLAQMLHSGPFTGLMLEAMEPQLAGFFGAPKGEGLLIQSVVQGSPADHSGLRAGDVILRVDSVTVSTSSAWARRLHASHGRPVSLTVLRDRHERIVVLTPELKHKSEVEWPELLQSAPAFA